MTNIFQSFQYAMLWANTLILFFWFSQKLNKWATIIISTL